MARAAVGALLLLGLACCASCSRVDFSVENFGGEELMGHHGREEPVIETCKFYVPPSMSVMFVENWNAMIGTTMSNARGNRVAHLRRPIITNSIYMAYTEWDTVADWKAFIKSHDAKQFFEFVEDHDIKFETSFLLKPTDIDERGRAMKAVDGRRGDTFSVLTMITMEPHHAENFISQFEDTAMQTMNENGNYQYALRRVATANHRFYVYGTWVSEQAWKEHRMSDHVLRLTEWVNKHDVVYFESPVKHLSEPMY